VWVSSDANSRTTSPDASSKVMKKARQNLSHSVLLGVLLSAFFIPLTSFAQGSGHFVLISQGQNNLEATSSCPTGDCLAVGVGTGYTGTTTGAFVYVSNVTAISSQQLLNIKAYTNSSYTTQTSPTRSCIFSGSAPANSNHTLIQLSPDTCSTYVLYPNEYYLVTTMGGVSNNNNWGSNVAANPSFVRVAVPGSSVQLPFPYFALVADGFQITPTASSTGVYLSGAKEFCSSTFKIDEPHQYCNGGTCYTGTSTPIGNQISYGLCLVGGYLFVPTAESVQQFSGLNDAVQGRIPFSYYQDTASLLSGLTASTTQNMTPFGLDLSGTALATSSVIAQNVLSTRFDLLSTTTIARYVPNDLYNFLYGSEVAAIWVTWLFVAYRRIVPTKAKI